jgi:hypothetical protein
MEEEKAQKRAAEVFRIQNRIAAVVREVERVAKRATLCNRQESDREEDEEVCGQKWKVDLSKYSQSELLAMYESPDFSNQALKLVFEASELKESEGRFLKRKVPKQEC